MQALAVEDDHGLRPFLSTALREEGYSAVEAESGDRALDRARDASYGCIILDVVLPGRESSLCSKGAVGGRSRYR